MACDEMMTIQDRWCEDCSSYYTTMRIGGVLNLSQIQKYFFKKKITSKSLQVEHLFQAQMSRVELSLSPKIFESPEETDYVFDGLSWRIQPHFRKEDPYINFACYFTPIFDTNKDVKRHVKWKLTLRENFMYDICKSQTIDHTYENNITNPSQCRFTRIYLKLHELSENSKFTLLIEVETILRDEDDFCFGHYIKG